MALVNGNMSRFSEDACKMMIDMFDANHSGTIDLNEFKMLFDCINRVIFALSEEQSQYTILLSSLRPCISRLAVNHLERSARKMKN